MSNDTKNNNTKINNTVTILNAHESENGTGMGLEDDPFDLDNLRLDQDFSSKVGVKKAILTIPVRKPGRQEFVRTHPDAAYRVDTAVLELKEDRETYIVAPSLWPELVDEITPKTLIATINRQGVLTLWPIRLPRDDGRIDEWNRSSLEAALLAKKSWVRLMANRSLGAYDVYKASSALPDPEWPELSLQEMIDIAFRDKKIRDLSHPVIKQLKGLT